jgi:hypothetical protein
MHTTLIHAHRNHIHTCIHWFGLFLFYAGVTVFQSFRGGNVIRWGYRNPSIHFYPRTETDTTHTTSTLFQYTEIKQRFRKCCDLNVSQQWVIRIKRIGRGDYGVLLTK